MWTEIFLENKKNKKKLQEFWIFLHVFSHKMDNKAFEATGEPAMNPKPKVKILNLHLCPDLG